MLLFLLLLLLVAVVVVAVLMVVVVFCKNCIGHLPSPAATVHTNNSSSAAPPPNRLQALPDMQRFDPRYLNFCLVLLVICYCVVAWILEDPHASSGKGSTSPAFSNQDTVYEQYIPHIPAIESSSSS